MPRLFTLLLGLAVLSIAFEFAYISLAAPDEMGNAKVNDCIEFNPNETSICTRCLGEFALDAEVNECVSQHSCWERGKVYIDSSPGYQVCKSVENATCNPMISRCMCPPGYVVNVHGSHCITIQECWDDGNYYAATQFPQNAGASCFVRTINCPAEECYCPANQTVGNGTLCGCVDPHCTTCNWKDNTCTACADGYYLSGSAILCLACQENCEMCGNATTCSRCKPGFFLNTTGKCLPCREGCVECTSFDICGTCTSEYTGPNCTLKCTDVIPGCWKCSDVGTRCERCWIEELQDDGTCTKESTTEKPDDGPGLTKSPPSLAAGTAQGLVLMAILNVLMMLALCM